ncbi:hypothetical protein AN1V17_00700 [Vallitalea sediminicola]
MNDMQITIFILGNPIFAIMFYSIGKKIINSRYSIKLPFLPKSRYYYHKNNLIDNYHYQKLIFIPSMILAVFCSAILSGVFGGELYLPNR